MPGRFCGTEGMPDADPAGLAILGGNNDWPTEPGALVGGRTKGRGGRTGTDRNWLVGGIGGSGGGMGRKG